MSNTTQRSPSIVWDDGSAYDLFISLFVLHHPARFGLRASWAAGVRSRLSPEIRRTLEEADIAIRVPLHWIHELLPPKNATGVLRQLSNVPIVDRLAALTFHPQTPASLVDVLTNVAARQSWALEDNQRLRSALAEGERGRSPPKDRELEITLGVWANPSDFGERLLVALQSYCEAFFYEEERRLEHYLETALSAAQELAQRTSLNNLLEALSQGLYLPNLLEAGELVLAPSFWITPLVYLGQARTAGTVMVFGARPADASLVPGESVPDALLQSLRAMADPTRLRILRYLSKESLTQAELARRLRLRAPTVTHHLSALRLAGLVHITLEAQTERRYSARLEAVEAMLPLLKNFMTDETFTEFTGMAKK